MNFNELLFCSADLSGCGFVRSFLPSKYLDAHFMGGYSREINIDYAKNIIFQRHTHHHFLKFIDEFHAQGKDVYYDLDDDLWDIHPTNPAYVGYPKPVLDNVEKIIAKCDGVFTSTTPLKQKLLQYHTNVNIVPNLVEIPRSEKQTKNKIRIGYAGSTSHANDFSHKLIYSLKKIHNKYKDKVDLIFVGYVPEALKPHVHFVHGIETQYYTNTLNYFNFDISLIPLADTDFNKSKSNLKFLEMSICRSCSVASDVYCYSEIQNNNTGIKVNDEKWYDIIEYLIFDDEKRKTIANNAYDYVMQNYTWQNAKHKQEDVYRKILKK